MQVAQCTAFSAVGQFILHAQMRYRVLNTGKTPKCHHGDVTPFDGAYNIRCILCLT